MGGCCSTSMKSETHVPKRTKHQFSPESDQYNHRRTPTQLHESLPIHDEETVKEVLSETHFLKSPSQLQRTAITITHNQHYTKKDESLPPEEIATENSDFRSLADSLSTATRTTVAEENRDEDGEVNQCRISQKAPGKVPRKRSIPGSVTGGGVGTSPARRSAQLPVKTAHAKVSSVRTTPPVRLRSEGTSTSIGRDTGDFSRRGIRNPVRRDEAGALHRRAATQRSPNNVKPLMRKRMQPAASANVKKEENAESAESVENPIVSLDLECFIFL